MKILGVDPGLARCGWGIVRKTEDGRQKTEAVDYGCVETGKELPMPERLNIISEELKKILQEHKPEVVAIEKLFFGANEKTALNVGQARGVIILTCQQFGIPISEYTPLQIKMALTGYGRADKQQIQRMVKMLLHLKEIPKPDDAADGLAIALTCGFQSKTMR